MKLLESNERDVCVDEQSLSNIRFAHNIAPFLRSFNKTKTIKQELNKGNEIWSANRSKENKNAHSEVEGIQLGGSILAGTLSCVYPGHS